MNFKLDPEFAEDALSDYLNDLRKSNEEEFFNALILLLAKVNLLPSTYKIEELLSVFDNDIKLLLASVVEDADGIDPNDSYFYLQERYHGTCVYTFKDWQDFCDNHLTRIFDDLFWESGDTYGYLYKHFFDAVEGFKERYIKWLEENGYDLTTEET